MFKRHVLAQSVQRALWTTLALTLATSNAFAEEEEKQLSKEAQEAEVITVTGVRNSLREAAFMKKSAEQIMDAISAEDIGQLPDNNIAEALQRVTGVQIGRDDTGAGSGFQVRGLSQNRVEVNGQSMAGSGESRSNSFSTVDTALFKAIEVYKSPTADMVEGAIGATIRLKTFKPLERKNGFVSLNAQGTKDELADDTGKKFSIAMSDRWDLGSAGQLGALLNVSDELRFSETHDMRTNWSPAIPDQIAGNQYLNGSLREQVVDFDENGNGAWRPLTPSDTLVTFTSFRPEDIEFKRQAIEQTNLSVDSTIQWQPTDNLEFTLFAQYSDFERISQDQVLKYGTRRPENEILDFDLIATERDDSPVLLGQWDREAKPQEKEYYLTQTGRKNLQEIEGYELSAQDYVQAFGSVPRYIVQSATISPTGNAYHAPVASQYGSSVSSTETKVFSFSTTYNLTDDLTLEAKYAYASSEGISDGLAQRFSPGTNNNSDNLNELNSAYVYYDFSPNRDIPDVGVLSINSDGLTSKDLTAELINPELYSLHNGWGFLTTNENEKDELSIDFDWVMDGDFVTKLEFGARFADNDMKRHKQALQFMNFAQHSVYSTNWLAYDGKTETRFENDKVTGNDKPSIAFAEQIMEERTGIENYYTRHMVNAPELFPNSSNANAASWMTMDMSHDQFKDLILGVFPGRQGDCLLFDKDEGLCKNELVEDPDNPDSYKEWDHILEIPEAQYVKDGSYPYLITESTKAIYGKVNFETELMNLVVSGNFGARYVETETTALGVKTTYFFNDELKQLKDLNGQKVEQHDPIYEEFSYSNFLPSLNVNVLLTDDMFVRVAVAKTMSRANPSALSPSVDLPNYSWTAKEGNPQLVPEEAVNYDLSWEWYINDTNSLSAAVFAKELSNFHTTQYRTIYPPTDRDGDGDFTNDPVTVSKPINGGDGSIRGVELAMMHTMDYLPGFLSGFGVQANYTYTDSNQDSGTSELDSSQLPVYNLSENSYNFILFYDKYGFNFRAAYNYRTENLNGTSSAGADPYIYERYDDYAGTGVTKFLEKGVQLPEWNDEFATLDLSASYKYKKFNFFIQARNLLSEPIRRYVGDVDTTKHILSRYQETGANYVAGVRVSL